ncbi:putative histone-arginine methyltransferase CARM1 [Neolecta irregularis DAH-3]|uniref:type I protein arginine methyltransferase n=1 Tax=Neolecta irregularis (strain DAH-3) TaxID=1198029 RepID=A0A1U7LGW1_NEOID|nr:putative histone-arginine methyltransferase CARM1 [Neolecta irregularis DAH-3]|eukprot:OLL21895.1 putative histone-arginine methyltransferase CARM1 [Neolecta irregularis DAH-3]
MVPYITKRITFMSRFLRPTEAFTLTVDFLYYAYHQIARTSLYRLAISYPPDFHDKTVLDVGSGSGILSFFALQTGAKKVYAVEASNVASSLSKLIQGNPWIGGKIEVINQKIEDAEGIRLIDTIISEPLGVFLLHERMVESFLYARKFLKPNGRMYPNTGTIQISAFSDHYLHSETLRKASFWEQTSFFGVDLSILKDQAKREVFESVIVGPIDPFCLISGCSSITFDFEKCNVEELYAFTVPIDWVIYRPGLLHGIVGWFDVTFPSSHVLSTSPMCQRTHWQQTRFLFHSPLSVLPNQRITGKLYGKVTAARSYILSAEILSLGETRHGEWNLEDQTYWYGLEGWDPHTAAGVVDQTHQNWYVPQPEQQIETPGYPWAQ